MQHNIMQKVWVARFWTAHIGATRADWEGRQAAAGHANRPAI